MPKNEYDPAPLVNEIRENLSPEAVAAIVAWLMPAETKDEQVNREIGWFRELLGKEILGFGSWDNYNRMIEELGL